MREHCRRDSAKYVPLDALLEMPRVRLLRMLSRTDEWLGAVEIAEHLDVGDLAERRVLSQCVSRGAADGLLEVRVGSGWSWIGSPRQYRITEAGRAELVLLLARANVRAPSEIMCVTCTGRVAMVGGRECRRCQAAWWRLPQGERADHVRRLAILDELDDRRSA